LVASIENLVVKIQLPTTLRELGVPELSESILAELVDLAASDPAIMFNPREATNEDLLDLLQRAY
jgi:alcohol dehydrogenase class IV